MLAFFFWVSLLLVVYTYLLYPVLLWLLTFRKRSPRYAVPAEWPSVSLIIAAYNEAGVIQQKIDNSLSLDYPRDKLQILVVSDCSDDGTDQIVAARGKEGVQLVRLAERSGKTRAQNMAVRVARGDILVFSDANSLYSATALKALVQTFTDPSIGCVCGELRYVNPDQGGAGKGEGIYWHYEQLLKRRESQLCSLVGANGSIYALRRELFDELGDEIISDFIMPIRIWRKRFQVAYQPEAVAVEYSAGSFRDEFRRRTRIIARSLHGLRTEAGVLNPLRHGLFALQLISHKVLRWLVPVWLIVAFVSSGVLAGNPLYRWLFLLQLGFYFLALLGNLFPGQVGRLGLFYVPAHFCAINLGALVGLWNFATGRRYRVWQPVSRG